MTAYPGNEPQKTTKTTIPFVKNNEFDYHWLVPTDKPWGDVLTWLLYIMIAIFIITAVSNGANLTDGLDGLATGVSAVIIVIMGAFAYLSVNIIYSCLLYTSLRKDRHTARHGTVADHYGP